MLYDRWRQIARACPEEIALRDAASGRQWTFRALASAAEQSPAAAERVVFPRGISADFILAVLQAWRAGKVICPLEPDQAAPVVAREVPGDIVHLKTTSATTGEPRMVAFTAEQLMADADQIVATMGLRPDWPNLGVISLAHSYGFSNLVLPLLLHGIPLTLAESALPESVRRAAAGERAITLAAVPALWRAWHDAGAIPSHVHLAISAGAPLPLALEQSVFATRGLKIHNFYGSTECGGIAYDTNAGPRLDGSCAGAPMRNVQLSVGTEGCLEVRSQAAGKTYWPEPDANLGNGMFRTNDVAEIAFGLVYLRGRAGDQINVAGRKVAPEAIEKILLTHPAVNECLVFGTPIHDGQRTEIIVACVVSRQSVSGETLRQFLLGKLPTWQVPREWWLVDSLAANDRGKVSRAEWRKRFLEINSASENVP